MKIAVVGAGAMGSLFGGLLTKAGNEVVLVDVSTTVVDALNTGGLKLDPAGGGATECIRVKATTTPGSIGPVDLVLLFVKCYHTEDAARLAAPLIGPKTRVLSLQNGWGNGPRLASIIGPERVLLGVCYHSATVLTPGHVRQGGQGKTFIGDWQKQFTASEMDALANVFGTAGIETTVAEDVVLQIWSKLALNVCTLPTSALLRLEANQLIQDPPVVDLMAALLREMVDVAQAQDIALDYDERWEAITGLLKKCGPGAKSSMLQDVEHRRRTEIDVINGAIVECGRSHQIATPHNDTMVWMVKAVETTFSRNS